MHTPPRLVPPSAATAIALLLFTALASSNAARPTAANASTPSARPTDEQLKSLISQLSADDFKQRNKAQRDLIALGDLAEPHLRDRLNQNPDPETRTLIEAALTSIARAREVGPTLVTLDLENAAPQDAFATLAAQAGLKISSPVDHLLDALRDERVTTTLDRATFWDALLTIAPQSGVAFTSIDAGGHLALEMLPTEGAAASPAATAGPFLVTISRIDCRGRWAAFSGQREVNAPISISLKPNPPCRLFFFAWTEPRLKPVRWFIDSIDECITDTGHDMRNAAPPQDTWRGSSGTVNGLTSTTYTLAAPDEKAKCIARLAMTARFVLAMKIQTLEVPDILAVKNATHWLGGFRLVINEVNKAAGGRYAYSLSLHRDNRRQADWDQFRTLLEEYPCYLVDADGNPFIGPWRGEESRPNQITVQSTIIADPRRGGVGEPAKMIWRFPQEIREVKVPLVFRDVPLP